MKARFEKYAHWEIILAFVIPFGVVVALLEVTGKNINQLGYSIPLLYLGLTIAAFVWAIRRGMKHRKILTLQIADGMFIVSDGKQNIIEEIEKDIELVLEKVTQRTSGTIYGQVGLSFMNRSKNSEVLMIIVQHYNHYNWKPDTRAKYILGLLGRYEIDKEEALKIIRYYGIHSPLV